MRIARQLDEIGRLSSPSLLTIGNFDGVHCALRSLHKRCKSEVVECRARQLQTR